MAKVELTLQEYDDLVLSRNNALQSQLKLRKELDKANIKYIKMLGKYLDRNASVWTHAFKEDVAINENNFKDYVAYSILESNEFTQDELYLAVKELYNERINKR